MLTLARISQSMFPVTPIWSIGHPPHTTTELCSSLPPSLARINQPINQSINQSVFPVTPIWSIGHPLHTTTELCFSLLPSLVRIETLKTCI
jgi:hypothetical protein